jgi:hypothetical protein
MTGCPIVAPINNMTWEMLQVLQPESRLNDLDDRHFADIAAQIAPYEAEQIDRAVWLGTIVVAARGPAPSPPQPKHQAAARHRICELCLGAPYGTE